MKNFFKQIFTWWNRQTFGTFIYTLFYGKLVGSDEFGHRLIDSMHVNEIDVSGVTIDPDHASGIAIILLDAQRQNHIVGIYGANMECNDDQLRAVKPALKDADMLLLQMEVPFHISLAAARLARELGVQVIWDPAPAASFPASACSKPDILTPNQAEAKLLTGIDVTGVESARLAAKALMELGTRTVVVKLGKLGAYYISNCEEGHVAAYEVYAVDTVAAGDAFGGALAVALSEGKSLREAVNYGAVAGAIAVTRQGAQESMPKRSEIEFLLKGVLATGDRTLKSVQTNHPVGETD